MHDPSRTPMHDSFSSVWDPAQTPMRPSTPGQGGGYDDSFDATWASIGGGSSSADLPGQSPFASNFGGSSSNTMGRTPFGESPFVASGQIDQFGSGISTGGFGAQAAADDWATGAPDTPREADAFDSNGSADKVSDAVERYPTGIQVRLGGVHDGSRGGIANVLADGTYEVLVSETGETRQVQHSDIEVVRPAKKDRLLIIKGELKGHVGTLIGIDGYDGIVKLQANSDIKILDLECCAKMTDAP